MKGNLQLRIATLCLEQWENMGPGEEGRFCALCAKTVIDFSAMSDREIITYLARSGREVCGRLSTDQLNRDIEFQAPPVKKRMGWWRWVLAGLLVSSEARSQHQPVKAKIEVQRLQVATKASVPLELGRNAPDSIKVQELPPVVVTGSPLTGKLGGLTYGICIKADTPMKWVTDSLNSLGLVPKKEWNIYPNPVHKGGAISLSWLETEPGPYEVGLFNTAGTLVQRRALQIEAKGQVDLLEIPGNLSAGVYFLRVSKPGVAKPQTRKLVVL
jgi:hypothetical protein